MLLVNFAPAVSEEGCLMTMLDPERAKAVKENVATSNNDFDIKTSIGWRKASYHANSCLTMTS
jgi:hypothetical protein